MFFLTPTLDLKLFLLVNQEWRNGLFDIIMPILSSMSVLLVAIALCIIVAVIKGGKKQVIFFLILLVGMGLSDFTTNIVKSRSTAPDRTMSCRAPTTSCTVTGSNSPKILSRPNRAARPTLPATAPTPCVLPF